MLNKHFQNAILKSVSAKSIKNIYKIQELWSGYGQILKYEFEDKIKSVIVKHIKFPDKSKHPLGINTENSHKRKLKSYKVEIEWYKNWASKCNLKCYVPKCLAIEKQENEILIVMEDLDFEGFSERKTYLSWNEIELCLNWFANFHAVFINTAPDKLWKNGTYWHLDTRPDELKVIKDVNLKNSAGLIDNKLKQAKYKTFVHGDAKIENFCFSKDNLRVAAVDFQYVGGGCGMKDIAYFLDSCLSQNDCEKLESKILDFYFSSLKQALIENNKIIDFNELENEWRSLYHLAWADFYRFLQGWSPNYYYDNTYIHKVTEKVISEL